MTDINTTGVAAATAAGMITVTGGVLGMHYDALIMGFLGGLAWLSYSPQVEERMLYLKTAGILFTSTMMAGAFASVGAAVAAESIQGVKQVDQVLLRSAAGFALGLFAHAGIPFFINWLRRKSQAS